MDRERIHREILGLVSEIAEVPLTDLTKESTFEELEIDSLNGLRIAAEMERRFGIVIPDEAITRIRSIADMLALADSYHPREQP